MTAKALADSWENGTDRLQTIAGRRSRRFYNFATRWMVSEVALHKELHNSGRNYLRMAKSFLNARIGRTGMYLTRGETEPSLSPRPAVR